MTPSPAVPDLPAAPDPSGLRRGYHPGRFDESMLAATWVEQFRKWFADASDPDSGINEPNAMIFGTADAAGQPSSRTVLMKGFDRRGFTLFTNYGSTKARQVAENPFGSLLFPWYQLERQVIVAGSVERVPQAESDAYFRSRPRGSQLGAWASHQSTVIPSRSVLTERLSELERRWPGGVPVPVPPFWGGLRLVPTSVEFWQGRPNRLHDRLRYRLIAQGAEGVCWVVERLAP
ncbi:pyridoxamine 5'-phosphate oxidase [Frankia sp. Cpl3]|nr:pyridoxamine 5'-phosphate oxidase [Frankia sp. Cpl3]